LATPKSKDLFCESAAAEFSSDVGEENATPGVKSGATSGYEDGATKAAVEFVAPATFPLVAEEAPTWSDGVGKSYVGVVTSGASGTAYAPGGTIHVLA
jgi:hypothetical protein